MNKITHNWKFIGYPNVTTWHVQYLDLKFVADNMSQYRGMIYDEVYKRYIALKFINHHHLN